MNDDEGNYPPRESRFKIDWVCAATCIIVPAVYVAWFYWTAAAVIGEFVR